MHPCKNMGLFIQHKGYPIALHPAASDCEFAVWNFTVGFCMNAADALSLLRAQAAENANGATVNLATLNNGAASLFEKYRAGSLALRPK